MWSQQRRLGVNRTLAQYFWMPSPFLAGHRFAALASFLAQEVVRRELADLRQEFETSTTIVMHSVLHRDEYDAFTVDGVAFGNNYLAVAFFFFDCVDVFAFFPGFRLGTHSGSFKVLSQASHAVTSRFSFSGSFKARFVLSPISSLRL